MDEVDGRIVAELMQRPLASVGDLCGAAGLTRNAVKARLARLRECGALAGFSGSPNPALVGRTGLVSVYPAPTPDRPNPPTDKVLAVEDVAFFSINHDGKLAAITYAREASREPPPALNVLMGGAPERTFLMQAPPLDPPGAALSPAQWRVLEAMVPDPRAPASAIAAATGLSAKSARRHREWLVKSGALVVQPLVLEGRDPSGLFYEIYAQGAGMADPTLVQRAIGGRTWILDRLEEPRGVLLLCMGKGLSEAVAALTRAKAAPGVEHAELVLGVEFGWRPERVQGWCREARAAAEKLRAAG